MNDRENALKNATFSGPEWMPCSVHISGASWNQLRSELEKVLVRHPLLFPGFEPGKRCFDEMDFGPAHRANERFKDNWGCVWESSIDGIEGVVVENPLEDWDKLETYAPPDPAKLSDRGPVDWDEIEKGIREAKARDELTSGGLPHGFFFMRLYYLRGFEGFMTDLAVKDPRLNRLIELLLRHNQHLVKRWIDMGVDVVGFADDLGTQTSSLIGPSSFSEWIAPAYAQLMQPCRKAGQHVHLHSDGYLMDLVDDLFKAGVTILNPQDLCNGIDNLARHVKGRMCIHLDIDRQSIVPFGTRQDIHDLIEEEVRKLGSSQGGLSMIAGIYPPTPPKNVDALCSAMEDFMTYWWDGRAPG